MELSVAVLAGRLVHNLSELTGEVVAVAEAAVERDFRNGPAAVT